MSRSTASEIQDNPCSKFLKWKTKYEEVPIPLVEGEPQEYMKVARGGYWSYYDKVQEKDIEIGLPFEFAVIDNSLVAFRGYNKDAKAGVWSNEIKTRIREDETRYGNQEISLRNKEGILMKFTWKEYCDKTDPAKQAKLKGTVKEHFGKFVNSVYIGVKVADKFEVWNLQITSSSLSGGCGKEITADERNDGWMNFSKPFKGSEIFKFWISTPSCKPKKNGEVKFYAPVFAKGKLLTAEECAELDELDKELQKYLQYYCSPKGQVAAENVAEEELEAVNAQVEADFKAEDDLPF